MTKNKTQHRNTLHLPLLIPPAMTGTKAPGGYHPWPSRTVLFDVNCAGNASELLEFIAMSVRWLWSSRCWLGLCLSKGDIERWWIFIAAATVWLIGGGPSRLEPTPFYGVPVLGGSRRGVEGVETAAPDHNFDDPLRDFIALPSRLIFTVPLPTRTPLRHVLAQEMKWRHRVLVVNLLGGALGV